jgi:hypothetical protein
MKMLNFPARIKIADENGYATQEFVRAMEIVVERTGGVGGDSGQDDFTSDEPPEQDIPIILQAEVLAENWPIGAVFISTVAANPYDLLGYGTWVSFGAGRVLVGLDPLDADFDTAEETGGAKAQAISAHAGTAVADHADHTHTFTQSSNAATPDLLTVNLAAAGVAASGTTDGPSAPLTHSVTQPNAHTDLSVVQPYIVVTMWKRTA